MFRRVFVALSLVLGFAVMSPAEHASAAAGCSSVAVVETCASADSLYVSSTHCHLVSGTTYQCYAAFRMDSAWGHGTLPGNLVASLDVYPGGTTDADTCTWSKTGGSCTVRSSSTPFEVSSSGVTMFCGGFTWIDAVGKATAVTPTGTYTDYRTDSYMLNAPPC
jgi:hypothetical protein